MATDRPTLVVAFVAALVTLSVCGAAQASTVKQYRTAPGNMHDTDVDGDHRARAERLLSDDPETGSQEG
jgi:hypothetical protein